MNNLKHIGRVVKTGRKCLVAYRTLPNDAFNCVIIPTETLDPADHDALMNLVESNASQESYEFAEVLARGRFPDGSVMLASLHTRGLMVSVGTDEIEMCPNLTTTINLAELNQMIAEQQGVSVQDLALTNPKGDSEVRNVANVDKLKEDSNQDDVAKTTSASVNQSDDNIVSVKADASPEDQAKQYRSQADKLSKQAAELRRMAEAIVPTKKRVAVKE